MKKRIISTLLLAAMLAMTACASDTPDTSTNDTTKSETTEETTTAIETSYIETLPREDFDGYEFRIIAQSYDQRPNLRLYEEENGEALNDAIIQRDRAVEERLNVKFVGHPYEDRNEVRDTLKSAVLSNEDAYDLVITAINFGINTLTTDGCLHELSSMKYLNLDSELWCKSIYDDFNVDGRLYFTSGALSPFFFYMPSAIAYNKTVTDNYGITGLEQLVRDGKWTFDTYVSIAKDKSSDLNGDGQMTLDDQFAAIGAYSDCYLLFGLGMNTVERTGESSFEMKMDSPKFIERLEMVANFFVDKNTVYQTTNTEEFLAMFQADRAMFMPTSMNNIITGYSSVPSCREMESDYGILPIPMYDEEQGEYNCIGQPAGPSGIAVPATCADTDRTSLIMETMAYYSNEIIRPAAYDSIIKGKAARVEGSEEMLDIVYDSVFFELNNMFDFGGTITAVRNAIKDGAGSFVSKYEAAKSAGEAALNDYIELLTSLE